jgi:hypothetical protein
VARYRFEEAYGQIRNSIIHLHGERPFILNGKYQVPDADKKCTRIGFEFLPVAPEMKKAVVELSLINEGDEWMVLLEVSDRMGRAGDQAAANNQTSNR